MSTTKTPPSTPLVSHEPADLEVAGRKAAAEDVDGVQPEGTFVDLEPLPVGSLPVVTKGAVEDPQDDSHR